MCCLQVENGPLHDSTVSASAKAGRLRELHCTLACGWTKGQHQAMPQESVDDWLQSGPRPSLGKKSRRRKATEPAGTISKICAQATAPWGLSTAPSDYQPGAFRSSTTTAGLGNPRPPCGGGMRGCEFTKRHGNNVLRTSLTCHAVQSLWESIKPDHSEIRGAENYWHVQRKPSPTWYFSCCV